MERTRCNQTSPETGDGWRDETGTGSKTRKGPRRPKSPFAGRVQMARLSPLKTAKNAGGRRGPCGQRGISSTGIPETTPARQVSGWTRDRDVDTDPWGRGHRPSRHAACRARAPRTDLGRTEGADSLERRRRSVGFGRIYFGKSWQCMAEGTQ